MNNENVLIESKSARNEALKEVKEEYMNEILNKVKGLVLLPDNMYVTTEMVANYFEVDKGLIKYHIKENKEELISDGLKVLRGNELKEFKEFLRVGKPCFLTPEIKTSPSLTLIPRRAILRLGMLIEKSLVAKQIRTYLLDIEENTTIDNKLIAVSQNTNEIVNTLKNEVAELKNFNSTIITENEEIKHTVYTLINKVDELLEQPLFKIHENVSRAYDLLIMGDFLDAMDFAKIKNTYSSNYTFFNKEFEIWTGEKFKNNKINKKQYWLSYYGLDTIKQFIYGIKQGIIVKNSQGYWVSKSGIYTNKIEWNRVLKEFDNKCAYCGSSEILIAEHIEAQSKDNSTDCCYNIVPACSHCNDRKDTMKMSEWLNIKRKEGLQENQIQKIRDHWTNYYIR